MNKDDKKQGGGLLKGWQNGSGEQGGDEVGEKGMEEAARRRKVQSRVCFNGEKVMPEQKIKILKRKNN